MPLSNKVTSQKRKSRESAVTYYPNKLEQLRPAQVEAFVALQQSKSSDFRASDEVAQITRLVDLEKEKINERVEQETLSRLKVLEERAYEEAYRLGREEGRADAFRQYGDQLSEQIKKLSQIAATMHSLTGDMYALNEALLVKLAFEVAQKIVMREVERDEKLVLSILKGALEEVRNEVNIKIRVSEEDFHFLTENRDILGEALDDLSRFHFEAVDMIDRGGCIVETNFGVIDAQMSERVQRVWEAISKEIPQAVEVRRR